MVGDFTKTRDMEPPHLRKILLRLQERFGEGGYEEDAKDLVKDVGELERWSGLDFGSLPEELREWALHTTALAYLEYLTRPPEVAAADDKSSVDVIAHELEEEQV